MQNTAVLFRNKDTLGNAARRCRPALDKLGLLYVLDSLIGVLEDDVFVLLVAEQVLGLLACLAALFLLCKSSGSPGLQSCFVFRFCVSLFLS